jgi:hypothetical protein
VKSIVKLIGFSFVFLACGVFLLAHQLERGSLSQHSFRVALISLVFANGIGLAIGVLYLSRRNRQKAAAKSPATPPQSGLSPETRQRRIWAIRGLKIWIAALMLGLVIGLTHAREHPWRASVVGVTMNLLTTTVLARSLFRLQKTLE